VLRPTHYGRVDPASVINPVSQITCKGATLRVSFGL
jgi:hypothetical protein